MLGFIVFIVMAILIVVALAAVPMRRHRHLFGRLNVPRFWEERPRTEPTDAVQETGGLDPGSGLSDDEREGFLELWRSLQKRFEEEPKAAVIHADLLISDVLEACGPAGGEALFDRPLREKYRNAHNIALRDKQGEAKPEALRKAMRYYGELFDELLSGSTLAAVPARDRSTDGTVHHHTA